MSARVLGNVVVLGLYCLIAKLFVTICKQLRQINDTQFYLKRKNMGIVSPNQMYHYAVVKFAQGLN